MPPRDRDAIYHYAERHLRDASIIFENGRRLEVPEIQSMSFELEEEPSEMAITSIGSQEATFSVSDADLNGLQDVIEEAALRQREAELQKLAATFNRMSTSTREALESVAHIAGAFSGAYGTSFLESLNAVWEMMDDDFELADEQEYVATDPISFDELMGGAAGDN